MGGTGSPAGRPVSPLQGGEAVASLRSPQGFALGFPVSPLWGEKRPSRTRSEPRVERSRTINRRASAVGIYNFVTGLLYLPASLIAGALWSVAPGLAFAVAAALSVLAMLAFGMMRPAGVR